MSLTEGKRIYAIGDVHGCLAELESMRGVIAADLHRNPHPAPILVFLGDYIDRGPDSRGVIEKLIAIRDGALSAIFLRGNHDQLLLDCFEDDRPDPAELWRFANGAMGGAETLASYGIAVAGGKPEELAAWTQAALPAEHLDFLRHTRHAAQIGGYIFAHAGIRPGVPLARQTEEDLIWIRDAFLNATRPHEGIVVHGHTPVPRAAHHGNRIEVDTGAVYGGRLSCVLLEDDRVFDLRASGRLPLRPHG